MLVRVTSAFSRQKGSCHAGMASAEMLQARICVSGVTRQRTAHNNEALGVAAVTRRRHSRNGSREEGIMAAHSRPSDVRPGVIP
jgi:hypothetical protein